LRFSNVPLELRFNVFFLCFRYKINEEKPQVLILGHPRTKQPKPQQFILCSPIATVSKSDLKTSAYQPHPPATYFSLTSGFFECGTVLLLAFSLASITKRAWSLLMIMSGSEPSRAQAQIPSDLEPILTKHFFQIENTTIHDFCVCHFGF